jgi:hypothetical protein
MNIASRYKLKAKKYTRPTQTGREWRSASEVCFLPLVILKVEDGNYSDATAINEPHISSVAKCCEGKIGDE